MPDSNPLESPTPTETCGRSWCVKEGLINDDELGRVTVHSGATLLIGDGHFAGDGPALEVHLSLVDGEPEPSIYVNEFALTPAQAMNLGGHLIGLATEAPIPA